MLAHPAVLSLSHNFSREDLFVVVYCLVDDWMHRCYAGSNLPRKRRGPRDSEFADSEVLTLLLVGELCQVKRERAWLRQVRASYARLFPRLPEDSRFCRRAQGVREALPGCVRLCGRGPMPLSNPCVLWTVSRCRCAPAIA